MMKNSLYAAKFMVLALSISFLTSCKKDTEAFPKATVAGGTFSDFVYGSPTLPSINDADGIIAAVHVHNYHIVTISPVEKEFQYGMAAFTNTTGNFSSLVSGGTVTVDTSNLTMASSGMYQSYPTTYSLNFSSPVSWNITGAGSVPAMTYTDVTGNPVYSLFTTPSSNISYWKDEWLPTYPKTLVVPTAPQPNHADSVRWINEKIKYSLDSLYNVTPFAVIPVKNYIANADTLVFTWHDNTGFSYVKKVPATDSLAIFTPNSFTGYGAYNIDGDFKMEMNAVKYSPVSSGGKKYYYIRMASYVKYWRTN